MPETSLSLNNVIRGPADGSNFSRNRRILREGPATFLEPLAPTPTTSQSVSESEQGRKGPLLHRTRRCSTLTVRSRRPLRERVGMVSPKQPSASLCIAILVGPCGRPISHPGSQADVYHSFIPSIYRSLDRSNDIHSILLGHNLLQKTSHIQQGGSIASTSPLRPSASSSSSLLVQ